MGWGLNYEYFDLLYFFNIMGYNFGVQLLPQLFPFNLNFQTLKKCFSEITRGFRRCRYKVVGLDRENRKTRKSVYSYTSPPYLLPVLSILILFYMYPSKIPYSCKIPLILLEIRFSRPVVFHFWYWGKDEKCVIHFPNFLF